MIYETDEDLVKAMDQLLANRSYQRELGLRGYRAYRQHWSTEPHMKRYLGLISNIIASRDLDDI